MENKNKVSTYTLQVDDVIMHPDYNTVEKWADSVRENGGKVLIVYAPMMKWWGLKVVDNSDTEVVVSWMENE